MTFPIHLRTSFRSSFRTRALRWVPQRGTAGLLTGNGRRLDARVQPAQPNSTVGSRPGSTVGSRPGLTVGSRPGSTPGDEQLAISLPARMARYVDAQITAGTYASASDYVRQLVRADQKRQAKEELEQTLLDAIQSGDALDLTPEKLGEVRHRVRGANIRSDPEPW